MKSALTKHIPKTTTKEDFEKTWNNSSYVMEPLVKHLEELVNSLTIMTEDDFNVSNHYALLAYRGGKIALAKELLELLPKYK